MWGVQSAVALCVASCLPAMLFHVGWTNSDGDCLITNEEATPTTPPSPPSVPPSPPVLLTGADCMPTVESTFLFSLWTGGSERVVGRGMQQLGRDVKKAVLLQDAAVAELLLAYDRWVTGTPPNTTVLVVTGEKGVGKTTAVKELIRNEQCGFYASAAGVPDMGTVRDGAAAAVRCGASIVKQRAVIVLDDAQGSYAQEMLAAAEGTVASLLFVVVNPPEPEDFPGARVVSFTSFGTSSSLRSLCTALLQGLMCDFGVWFLSIGEGVVDALVARHSGVDNAREMAKHVGRIVEPLLRRHLRDKTASRVLELSLDDDSGLKLAPLPL